LSTTPPDCSEEARQKALDGYAILDTPPDAVLDCITQAAKDLCDTPVALISLVDESRQWFKSKVGLSVSETSRDVAFCAHAIKAPDEIMEIEDATQDDRFANNPLVTDDPGIRFYAGKPLVTVDGFALGTLCVIDYKPRRLSTTQRKALSTLGEAIINQFVALRRFNSSAMQQLSERDQTHEQVLLRERAIEALDVGVSITDATKDDHPIVYINQRLCELTGYSKEELLGQGVRILQKNNKQQPEHLQIQAAQAKGESVQVQFQSTRKDGSQYMDGLSLSPVFDDNGKLTHYIGINQDVTAKLATEAKLHHSQKIDAVGQLTGGIAHDFNNHLSVILGNLELLSMDITNPEHREHIHEATSAAKMGARLTHRLLTFARQGQLEPTILNPNKHILEAIELLGSTVGDDITLTSALSDGLWSVRADPSEVENTIVNLAINARDAMPEGGTLSIESKNVHFTDADIEEAHDITPGEYVQLSVSDTGTGMSDETKAHIFEPFFTTKEEGKGTGLGLASIYGFARQSGGHVTVYSELNHGTVVNVYLPKHKEHTDSTPEAGHDTLSVAKTHARILVVEDNEQVRKVTLKRLDSMGYETLQAKNGSEAIKTLEQTPTIDLVFSDVVMEGGMSGYDVASWVQQHLPQCKILLTSGFNTVKRQDKNADVQGLAVLQKPYGIAELQNMLGELLDKG